VNRGTGRPAEQSAVEADDDWAAAPGAASERTVANAPGNADTRAPGLVEEATKGALS
jgi:hypothetical protein